MKKEDYFQQIRELNIKYFFNYLEKKTNKNNDITIEQETIIAILEFNSFIDCENYEEKINSYQNLLQQPEKYFFIKKIQKDFLSNFFIIINDSDSNYLKNLYDKFCNFKFSKLKSFYESAELNKNQKTISELVKNKFKNKYSFYLKTPYWKIISKEKLRLADYSCQLCNAKDTELNTHHSTYDIFGIEIYNMNKLIVLCKNCHSKFHNKEVK